jgi:hypothetical protein
MNDSVFQTAVSPVIRYKSSLSIHTTQTHAAGFPLLPGLGWAVFCIGDSLKNPLFSWPVQILQRGIQYYIITCCLGCGINFYYRLI